MNVVIKVVSLMLIILVTYVVPTNASLEWGSVQQQADSFVGLGNNAQDKYIDETSVTDLVLGISNVLVTIGVCAVLIGIMVLGIKYMMATPNEAAKLKTKIVGVVIAGIVIIGAWGIWNLAYKFFNNLAPVSNQEVTNINIEDSIHVANPSFNEIEDTGGNDRREEVGTELLGVKITDPVYGDNFWLENNLYMGGFNEETHDGVDIAGLPTSPLKALKDGTVTKIDKKKDISGNDVINITVKNTDGTEQQYLDVSKTSLEVGDEVRKGRQIAEVGYIPEDIVACARGTVSFVNERDGRVWVDSGNGLVIRYLHLSSVCVKEGDIVKQGQKLGEMGNIMTIYDPPLGRVHLHISFLIDGRFVNPRPYIYSR